MFSASPTSATLCLTDKGTPHLRGYAMEVQTNQDIRRANLRFLLEEVSSELGKEWGAASELSRRTGVSVPFISQFLRHQVHQGGTERKMGDIQARKLERGMGKPEGWMDVDRTIARDWEEAALLDKLRLLSKDQRAAVSGVIESYIKKTRE